MAARRAKSLKYQSQNNGGYTHRDHRSKKGRRFRRPGRDSYQAGVTRRIRIEEIKLKELDYTYDKIQIV